MLGDEGYNMILQELAKVGAYKKKDLDSVIIDTTVQIEPLLGRCCTDLSTILWIKKRLYE